MKLLKSVPARTLMTLIILTFIITSSGMAQKPPGQNFISINAGTGYMPMSDWRDFAENWLGGYYHRDQFGANLDARLTLFLGFKHAITINIERITIFSSAALTSAIVDLNGDTLDIEASTAEWHFRSMPVGLSYEYYPRGNDRPVLPYIGGGLSYYFTNIKGQLNDLTGSGFLIPAYDERDEKGYGLHLYAGLKALLHKKIYVETRLRARYADGSGLSSDDGDVKIEFTGIDLTAGIAWRF